MKLPQLTKRMKLALFVVELVLVVILYNFNLFWAWVYLAVTAFAVTAYNCRDAWHDLFALVRQRINGKKQFTLLFLARSETLRMIQTFAFLVAGVIQLAPESWIDENLRRFITVMALYLSLYGLRTNSFLHRGWRTRVDDVPPTSRVTDEALAEVLGEKGGKA